MKRKGNALLLALWTIAVLSVMVLSFVYEAHQQSGVNLYVRERNRVNRLTDAGQAIAETVILKYSEAPAYDPDQDTEKLLEDDRWVLEKQDLKVRAQCKIGPIVLDEDNPENGNVTIEIQSVNSGDEGIIDINQLWDGGGDAKYMERWWMIFTSHNIPEELSTPKDGTINLWNILIASWNDWRDENDDVFEIDGEDFGAESDWYEKREEEDKIEEEDRYRPRNGPIPDIKELSKLRGWSEYPEVLTGGVINPWAKDDDDLIEVKGLMGLFTTVGGTKININSCDSVDALVTIPGVYEDPENTDSLDEARLVAEAIIAAKKTMPENRDVDESQGWWEFTDFSDLKERTEEDVGDAASEYFSFTLDESTIFKVKITGESMGMKHEVNAECYVKEGKVRYIKWRED